MKEISKAILSVMGEIENIEKGLSVGTGRSSYKAVSDSDVRNALRKVMIKYCLVVLPISVTAKVEIERWQEISEYDGKEKTKQSVLTEANTEYMLIHSESGESIKIAGYGHGVDSQDKSAGKATTYALKNALLDTFLITKGEVEDVDATHSDLIDVPKKLSKSKPITNKFEYKENYYSENNSANDGW